MMNKKFFFFDIDYTLGLNISTVVPADTRYCLRQLKRQGHVVALATGRLQINAREFADTCGITSFVADGGNSLTVDGSICAMDGLPLNACKAFLRALDKHRIPWCVVTENKAVRYTPFSEFTRLGQKNYFKTIVTPIAISSLTCIYKIIYACDSPAVPEAKTYRLPHMPYLDGTCLVEPMDKGRGIRRMAALLHAAPEDIVVFGDGLNDISMFTPPFFRIAMGNARPQLKALADYVTDANDAGGIFHACRKFGWLDHS